jgi:long-chain acyl-CoA synthetase
MEGAQVTSERRAGRRALDASTMCEAFQITAARRCEKVALRTFGDEVSITFGEYAERVRRLAGGLHELGVRRGDTVGFMLSNRPEFHLLDTAVAHLGATPFSIYNTSAPDQIEFLLDDAGNQVMIVEAAFLDRAGRALATRAQVEHLILLDGATADSITLGELESAQPGGDFDFEASWRAVTPDDVLTLIYTSGTTGPPKGVQLTHANQLAQSRGLDETMAVGADDATVSFLPMAHIADRGLTHYAQMVWGSTITCCPDVTRVFAYVADARPTRFGAVPRVWEKLKAALEAGFAAEPDEARRAAIADAVALGIEKLRLEQAGEPLPTALTEAYERAEAAVFAPVRARLGFDRCRSYVTGAAPSSLETFEFFGAIGIPIREVWGMSELCSIATIVPEDPIRYGTVGVPIAGVEVRLDDDGELLVRGGTVMAGYRNQPEKTADTIDADGWLRTGDIGSIDELGFLTIIDRKKELIINAAGKNMSPANIEQQLKQGSPLIGQAIAIGDRRPYNVALIVLDPDALAAFAARHGLPDPSAAAMAGEPAVLAEVADGVERANSHLSRIEQIKRFKVLECDWAPGGDELTATMKLRRKPITAKYAHEIDALYA